MIRGLYTAAAGMITQQNRNDILSNNLANVNTPGFKEKQGMVTAFPEVLINAVRMSDQRSNQPIGSLHQGVFLEEGVPTFLQGDLMDTGIAENMAIWDQDLNNGQAGNQSSLFFTLQDANGQYLYTRSGLFTQDSAGQLVTPEGYLVLDDTGRPIDVNGRSFTMDDKGNIRFADGEELRVGLTQINDLTQLQNQGNQAYVYNGNQQDLNFVDENANYKLYQGKLERSNVDTSKTITEMMTALRMYEANQQVIQSLDKTLDKAVNEIGRV